MIVRRAGAAALAVLALVVTGCSAPEDAAGPGHAAELGGAAGAWWRPGVRTTWQWQLRGPLDTRYPVDVYDVDLFDTPHGTVDTLHEQGRRVICYFSAGSSEDWRPDDGRFAPGDRGEPLDGWPGERWLRTDSPTVRAVLLSRLDMARDKGCDGVEPDNVDGYANDTGLGITADDQLAFDRFLADEAHRRGLAAGLKNDVDQVGALAGTFDFAVNEQCRELGECGVYDAFTTAGKPVFVAEYAERFRGPPGLDALCAEARRADRRTLVLPLELDGSFRLSCDG